MTRKLVCALLVIALVAAPFTAFASQFTIDYKMHTGQMAGVRILGWQDMVDQLTEIEALCEDVEVHTVAEWFGPQFESDAGFPLYFAKLGHGDTVMWITAQMHGNEKLTTVGLMEFIWEYAKNADLRAEFADLTFYIVPIYNVDGGSESTNISYKGIAGRNGIRGCTVWREDGTTQSTSFDLNRDWKMNQRGEGMGFQAKTTQGYYRLWCEVMPDYSIDNHHQGSYIVNNNPITFSLGMALMPSSSRVPAVADPIAEGLLPAHTATIYYAVTLPFIKNGLYDDMLKQIQKSIYDKINADVQKLFVYTSASPNSTTQAAANGAAIGDPYVNSCIDLYPGLDLYGVGVAGTMMGLNFNGWNPYRWSCPSFYVESEYQFNSNQIINDRHKGIALQTYYYALAAARTILSEDYKAYDPEDYYLVQHMTSGSRCSINTVYGVDRRIDQPPIDFSFMDTIKVGVKAPAVSAVEEDVAFTVEIFQPKDVLTAELAFEVTGPVAGIGVEGVNGFEPLNDIFWTYAGNNSWKGEVTMTYCAGDSTGYTNRKLADIAKFVFAPTGEEEATMTLTGFKVVGLDGGTTKYLASDIAIPAVTTSVEQTVYSKYDLNRDNTVDALDLGIMLLYCGFKEDDPEWATLIKVNDSKGKPVTASMCDVNNDGLINMLDLIDLFINYTK